MIKAHRINGRLNAPQVPDAICAVAHYVFHCQTHLNQAQLLFHTYSICHLQPSCARMLNMMHIFNSADLVLGMPQTATSAKSSIASSARCECPRIEGRLPQSWNHKAQETQFCGTKDGESAIEYWEGGYLLYSRRGAQRAAAFCRASKRGKESGLSWCEISFG